LETCDDCVPGEADDVVKLLETLSILDAFVELLQFFEKLCESFL
jgi:hypothetical protein